MTAFSAHGFGGASIRGIARDAGVDPALVHRFFGDKEQLLLATVKLGFNPLRLIDRIAEQGPEGVGNRIITTALSVWESPWGRTWVATIRQRPQLLPVMVGFLSPAITETVVRVLGYSRREAEIRSNLAEVQMVGLVTTRYVARIEPIASMPIDEVARLVGPLLQHVITGDIGLSRRHG